MTSTIRQRNGHVPHRHHSRLSRRMRRQAFAFARMFGGLPFGSYTIQVTYGARGIKFEPIVGRAVESKETKRAT
jgi:hypothetical protein